MIKNLLFLLVLIITVVTPYMYYRNKDINKQSLFEEAANLLAFKAKDSDAPKVTTEQKQEALLKIFNYAGYFRAEKIWHDINALGFNHPKKTFIAIMRSLEEANVNQEFNAAVARKNLFNNTDLKIIDILDYLLYLGQDAFARNENQERTELNQYDWMQDHKSGYLEAARVLGVIDKKLPRYNNYTETWIAGASRVGVFARLINLNYLLSQGLLKTTGNTLILAGQRPLWAEIDGISPSLLQDMKQAIESNTSLENFRDISHLINDSESLTLEAKEYMTNLAKENGIKLAEDKPFISYTEDDVIPEGFYINRIYPNYLDLSKGYLSETLMSYDLLKKYLSDKVNIGIIDTKSGHKGARPDTATTARDAAQRLVKKILAENQNDGTNLYTYYISFHSNQPYIDRQTLTAQREVNKVLKENGISNIKIVLDRAGFSAKEQDVAKTHSELGAKLLERYRNAMDANKELKSPRTLEQLMYRTRPKLTNIPPMPNYKERKLCY